MRSAWLGKKGALAGALVAAASLMAGNTARASTIQLVNWKAVPDSSLDEMVWDGSNLSTGPGAFGNADGTNLDGTTRDPSLQTAPGLQVDTVVSVPLTVPGSFASSTFTGGTGFYDSTLAFTGLAPAAANSATQATSFGIVTDSQVLGDGTFTFLSTTSTFGGSPSTEVPLLTGTITNALITGLDGTTTGAILSGTVNYTGGAIFSSFPANFVDNNNAFSISMTGVTPAFGVTGTPGDLTLNNFAANATGLDDIFQVTVVPEPGTIGMGLSMLGLAALGIRRRRTA